MEPQNGHKRKRGERGPRGGFRWPVALLLIVPWVGLSCGTLVETRPEETITDADLDDPDQAGRTVNGALAVVSRAYGQVLGPYAVASDELTWVGTQTAWERLDRGFVEEPDNRYTDAAFAFAGEARWVADEAIRRLERFDAEGTLEQPRMLLDAYQYGALAYLLIGDLFEDFTFSDRANPAPPLGPNQMIEVYDDAIDYLTRQVDKARAVGSESREKQALLTRARAYHARAVWQALHRGPVVAPVLIRSQAALADIQAVQRLETFEADERLRLEFTAGLENNVAWWVNLRGELAPEPGLGQLVDPVTGRADPRGPRQLDAYRQAGGEAAIDYTSVLELRLIEAEAALAVGDSTAARLALSTVRRMSGIGPVDDETALVALLIHERRVNLWMQGRRLHDLYRFGLRAPRWDAASAAAQRAAFFPITVTERTVNPFVSNRQ